MEPVRRPPPGIRVVTIDDRSYILLEEYTLILLNFLALFLPHLSGRIEAQNTLNPSDDRRYVLPEEHIPSLINLLALPRPTNFDLPAEAENSRSEMLNKYALISDLLSERRGRDVSCNCGEGSRRSHSEAPQSFNDGSGMSASSNLHSKAPEIVSDFSNGINSPPGQYVSIDIPSVVNQECEQIVGGDLHGRKREIPTNRINSPPEPYVSIDIQSVVDQQQRKEHIGGEPASTKKRDNYMISETTLAIAAQAAASLVSKAFSGSAHSSWTSDFVAVATVFGISFPLLGIGLLHVKPKISGIMAKLGAVAMSSAIILALGLTVVPGVAWTAGTMACLLIAIGVFMA